MPFLRLFSLIWFCEECAQLTLNPAYWGSLGILRWINTSILFIIQTNPPEIAISSSYQKQKILFLFWSAIHSFYLCLSISKHINLLYSAAHSDRRNHCNDEKEHLFYIHANIPFWMCNIIVLFWRFSQKRVRIDRRWIILNNRNPLPWVGQSLSHHWSLIPGL